MYEIFRTTSFKKDYKKLSNKEKDLLKSIITTLAEGKKLDEIRVVVIGAGAAGLAAAEMYKALGIKNIVVTDSKGAITKKRTDLNKYKEPWAVDEDIETLADAMKGADVIVGNSVANCITQEMVKTLNPNALLLVMANPDPEIKPGLALEVRPDLYIGTGRSDYPNQVNNVLGFPFIFRGALDVRAKIINKEMKVAAAHAIAELARETVPDEVAAAMGGERPKYGKEYIIPSTFDPRLISVIPVAVAKAAVKSGVARKKIKDFEVYKDQLKQRLDPSVTIMQGINSQIKKTQKRVVFAEGEDENTLKAAIAFKNSGLGTPILVAKDEKVKERLREIGLDENFKIEIVNSTNKEKRT